MSEIALESNDSIFEPSSAAFERTGRLSRGQKIRRTLGKRSTKAAVTTEYENLVNFSDYKVDCNEDMRELGDLDDPEQEISLMEREDLIVKMVNKYKSSNNVLRVIDRHRSGKTGTYSGNDTATLLNTAGSFNLLSDQENAEYYSAIDKGVERYLNGIDLDNLSFEDEKIVLDLVAAHQVLMLTNLRLVISIAKPYRAAGLMTFSELIQEGNIGLSKAICRLDISKGFKPSTYIQPWVYQSIKRAIGDKSRAIRVPTYKHDIFLKIKYQVDELTKQLCDEPSVNEIIEYTGLSEAQIAEYMRYSPYWLTSLNSPTICDTPTEIGDVVEDKSVITEEEVTRTITISDLITKVVKESNLDDRTRIVFGLFYGLEYSDSDSLSALRKDGTVLSYSEAKIQTEGLKRVTFLKIGSLFGFSASYAKQLAKRGIRTLESHPAIEEIKGCL